MMQAGRLKLCLAAGLLALIVCGAFSVQANSTNVSPTYLRDGAFPIADSDKPELFKPPECDGITLTSLVVGGGNLSDGAANSLILGSAGADKIRGGGGDDCILGGAGDDEIYGDQNLVSAVGGDDVILGGPGDDELIGDGRLTRSTGGDDLLFGQDGADALDGDGPLGPQAVPGTADDCRGGNDLDMFANCESQIQD